MIFLYLPILIMIAYSFNEAESFVWSNFSLKWYHELFRDRTILNSFLNSIILGIVSSVLATCLGTCAAIGISNLAKKTRAIAINISNIPIINPEIVTGISLMLLFSFIGGIIGFEPGFATVLLAHICFSTPYVILNVLPKLRQLDPFQYEAALDLGCPPVKAFRKVVFPEILPALISGFLMAFTFSLDDFIITNFTSGPSFQTLPMVIYPMLKKRLSPRINALTALLFLAVFLLLLIINLKDIKNAKKADHEI